MPIIGLRKLLEQVEKPVSLNDQIKPTSVIGIDAMKLLVDCVSIQEIFKELKDGGKQKAETFLFNFIRSIQKHGHMVVLVFPGRTLPPIPFGDNAKVQRNITSKPFSFKTDIMQAFVTVIHAMGIPYMVAPYEQIAQLKYLSEIGLIDYVMTDNSDAIGYLCEKTLMDYDYTNETAILYDCNKFLVLNDATASAPLLKVLRKFGIKSLPLYCSLQGCEYVQVKGFGPKKAIKMFIYFWHLDKMPDPNILVKRMKVSRDTEKLVVAAYNIFSSQIIYDFTIQTCRSLKSIVGNKTMYDRNTIIIENLPSYCGLHLDSKALEEYNKLQPKHFLVPTDEDVKVVSLYYQDDEDKNDRKMTTNNNNKNGKTSLTKMNKKMGNNLSLHIKRVDTNIYKHNAMASVYYKRLNDLYTNASYFM